MFDLGRTVATAGVVDYMERNAGFSAWISECFYRHSMGDWGDICEEDYLTNEEALRYGERLMSVYKHDSYPTVWIITEADRSATMALFPDEY